MPRRVWASEAILCAARVGGRGDIVRRARPGHVPAIVGLRLAGPFDAHVGARDVVEPVTIERTNLHVLDRLGLDGKIGCLCPRDRNHTRCGTEEETFHHLHLSLQIVLWEGSVSAGCTPHPWKVPFSPRFRSMNRYPTEPTEPATSGYAPLRRGCDIGVWVLHRQ